MNISSKNAGVVGAIGTIALGAVFLNALVIVVFVKSYRTWKFNNVFVVSIATCDILQACLGFATELSLSLDTTLISHDSAVCLVSAFFTCSFAFVVIAHFTAISLVRWLAMFYPFIYRKWFKDSAFYTSIWMVLCYAYGFGWAALGLTPWSDFDVDIDGMRCSMDWKLKNKNSFSYIVTVMVTCFVIPALIMLFVAITVMAKVNSQKHRVKKRRVSDVDNPTETKRERMFVRLIVCTVIAFYLAWTPYAICALLAIFRNIPSALLVTISAIFAKLSAVVNPICLCFIKSSFRKKIRCCYRRERSLSTRQLPSALSNGSSCMNPADDVSMKEL